MYNETRCGPLNEAPDAAQVSLTFATLPSCYYDERKKYAKLMLNFPLTANLLVKRLISPLRNWMQLDIKLWVNYV